ncbi:type VII secretion system-associated protein [Streptomyces canus]|uniref:type VII secretion system-associated protein n=1 Tax=Streptomyces canus TaxID=58343 RepID=UPI0033DE48A8
METPLTRPAGQAAPPQTEDPQQNALQQETEAEQDAEYLVGGLPPVPDDIRMAARRAPDHWLGIVDPAWTAEEPPPEWAVIGEWRSGPAGQIEEWQPNKEYRPSPQMLGWPEPSDPVDAAVQLAVTGYAPLEDAVRALSTAEVTVLRSSGGAPLVASGPDGTPVVPVFTSVPHQAFAQGLAHTTVAAAELADQCAADGTALSVNPAGPASLVVGAEEVRGALRGTPFEDTPAPEVKTRSPSPLPPSTERTP